MEGGNALAGILFGDVNPSGKLPCTFPVRLSDSPAHALGAFPGKDGTERYAEGLLVGYRWYDTRQVAPLFAFGHGLSYTQFGYSGLRIEREGAASGPPAWRVRFDLTNIGDRAGAETAQVYVRELRPGVFRPFKELKGFAKAFLRPGEKRTLSVPLEPDAFAFYNPGLGAWMAEKGEFEVMVGSSSRDIRLQGPVRIEKSAVLADNELGRQ
jgi:beta-glucosidase